jgi:hypothetical protein
VSARRRRTPATGTFPLAVEGHAVIVNYVSCRLLHRVFFSFSDPLAPWSSIYDSKSAWFRHDAHMQEVTRANGLKGYARTYALALVRSRTRANGDQRA